MRVSLGLPTHRVDIPELVTGDGIMAMARAAEEAGFEAVFVTEHPFPGDEWMATGGHHALDPFVALSFAAAATTRLRLQTNLLVVAYRNPFLAAKAIASLDAASGGRTIIGIGAGYLAPEFEALGVDIDERNELVDEALGAMRAAWSGESVVASGRHWKATGNTMRPRPARDPTIWIGGNTRRAMRRAVEQADGWVPMLAGPGFSSRVRSRPISSAADLRERVEEARAHAAAIGRSRPFDVAISPRQVTLEDAEELAGAGATFLNAGVPGDSVAEVVGNITRMGSELLPKITALPVTGVR